MSSKLVLLRFHTGQDRSVSVRFWGKKPRFRFGGRFSGSAVVNRRLAVSSKPVISMQYGRRLLIDVTLRGRYHQTTHSHERGTPTSDDHLTLPFIDTVIHSLSLCCAHTVWIDHQTLNAVGVVAVDCNDCPTNKRPSVNGDQTPHTSKWQVMTDNH